MPELPEVESIVRRLRAVLPGKKLVSVEQLHAKTWQGESALVVGSLIQDVRRRAKIIQIVFANELSLLIHLKMTGQLIYVDEQQRLGGGHPTADWVSDLPAKHTRVAMQLDPTSQLFFNDQRLFGWMKVMTPEQVREHFAEFGPDINDPIVTTEYLASKLKNKSTPIKVAIMDNTIMAGLGNIYACDALNVAQISPTRPAKSLSLAEVDRLLKAAQLVIQQGVAMGGTTFDGMYVGIDGLAGGYQDQARVYDREGQACQQCGGKIVKIKLGGRGTYFCSQCQV